MIKSLILTIGMLSMAFHGAWAQQAEHNDEVLTVEEQVNHAKGIAQHLANQGQWRQAQEAYKKILNDNPKEFSSLNIQRDVENLNVMVLLSNAQTPQTVTHVVRDGETVGKIAKMYGTTIDLIYQSNNLKNHLIHIGQKLRIWVKPFTITIDKSENILVVRCEDKVIKTYQVATGADNITPIGDFTITSRIENPTWFKKGVPIPPGVPENALGTRWLGFNKPQYGIHGTIHPELIGQQVSHGCVRMRNSDVEELYTYIPNSTKVTIHD